MSGSPSTHAGSQGQPPRRVLARRLMLLLAGVGSVLLASQLRCAEVESGWFDDGNTPPGSGDGGSGGDGGTEVRCFSGTAITEQQLLNRCTEAERVERPSRIPTMTWDGKSKLPYEP